MIPSSFSTNQQNPSNELWFEAFKQLPDLPNVIIVGQDPYPQPGVATGIAFAVKANANTQPSLDVIIEELAMSYYHDISFDEDDIDKTLISWVKQGVLMLNASLTCDKFAPEGLDELFKNGTHSYYWRVMLMEQLFQKMNGLLSDCVFVFMGQKAQYYSKYIDSTRHTVIKTVHPIVDYRLSKQLFIGSRVFNDINDALKNYNKQLIQWKK